jgi:dTDP-L-rhamnose 4-epimerase
VKILVTGGAGFVGSHLVDALLEAGHEVRVLDNLYEEVHGEAAKRPDYLSAGAEMQVGDVRDPEAVRRALEGVEIVFHLAAIVGVGQSMYEMKRYVSANSLGAAVLLEEIVARRDRIRKILVASSMSIYGEGAYRNARGEVVHPTLRSEADLEARRFEIEDADGRPLQAIPTSEAKPLHPTSIYAVTKRDHEEMFLSVGAAYGIPAVALRYFNIYGRGRAPDSGLRPRLRRGAGQPPGHGGRGGGRQDLQRRDRKADDGAPDRRSPRRATRLPPAAGCGRKVSGRGHPPLLRGYRPHP